MEQRLKRLVELGCPTRCFFAGLANIAQIARCLAGRARHADHRIRGAGHGNARTFGRCHELLCRGVRIAQHARVEFDRNAQIVVGQLVRASGRTQALHVGDLLAALRASAGHFLGQPTNSRLGFLPLALTATSRVLHAAAKLKRCAACCVLLGGSGLGGGLGSGLLAGGLLAVCRVDHGLGCGLLTGCCLLCCLPGLLVGLAHAIERFGGLLGAPGQLLKGVERILVAVLLLLDTAANLVELGRQIGVGAID